MKAGITREVVVDVVKSDIKLLINKKESITEVADSLENKYGIPKLETLALLNNPRQLSKVPIVELALLGEEVAMIAGKDSNWIEDYFTKNQIKDFRIYKRPKDVEDASLEFHRALKVNNNAVIVVISRRDIAKYYDLGIWAWDAEVQREGVARYYNDEVSYSPKMNLTNVREIKDRVLKNTLLETMLVYNVVKGSTGEGSDWIYNEETGQLVLPYEFIGQILDGTHRSVGIHRAWMENANILGYMPIMITNYDVEEAKEFQYQLSKATPIDISRARQLGNEYETDKIVQNLMSSGVMKGKISKTKTPDKILGELVSFLTLSDAFHQVFNKDKVIKVGQLTKNFDDYMAYLFEYFEAQLDSSDIIWNTFFHWHVRIMKFMMDNDVPFLQIDKVIKPEYFNRTFVTEKLGILKFGEKTLESKKGIKLLNEMLNNYIEMRDSNE